MINCEINCFLSCPTNKSPCPPKLHFVTKAKDSCLRNPSNQLWHAAQWKAHSIKSKHLGSVPEPASNSAVLIPLGPNFLVSKMSKASYDYHTLCKLHYSFIQYLVKTYNAYNGDIKCLQEPTEQMRWRNNIHRGKGTWKICMEET